MILRACAPTLTIVTQVGDFLSIADRLWRGELDIEHLHPLTFNGDGSLVEITDGVAFVPSFARVSAFDTDDGLLLVDTGHHLAAAGIHRQLRSWTASRLNTAIFSHGHIDHAGGAATLKERLGVPIAGPHRGDLFLLESLADTGRGFGIEDARDVIPDRWLDEGDQVAIGEVTLKVLHVPGHSPGSVALFNAAQRFAVVGDALFQGSIGRTYLPGGDHAQLISSIKEKLLPLGDDVAFICGHGPGSTMALERVSNPFLR